MLLFVNIASSHPTSALTRPYPLPALLPKSIRMSSPGNAFNNLQCRQSRRRIGTLLQ